MHTARHVWFHEAQELNVVHLPGQVHGQSAEQLSVLLRLFHQRDFRVSLRQILNLLGQQHPGAIQLSRQVLVLLRERKS